MGFVECTHRDIDFELRSLMIILKNSLEYLVWLLWTYMMMFKLNNLLFVEIESVKGVKIYLIPVANELKTRFE